MKLQEGEKVKLTQQSASSVLSRFWHKTMAEGRIGRGLMVPLLAVNFVVYLIVLGLAGWSIDKYIDGEQDHPLFALIGGAMGAASVLSGFMHRKAWVSASLASATSSAVLSWGVTAVAFGFAWKEIKMGGHRGKRLQTLELFITISTLSQFLYLLLLHAGMFNARYGPDTAPTSSPTHRLPAQATSNLALPF